MRRIWLVVVWVSVVTIGAWSQSRIPLRFTLDWAFQGPQAPFLVALYKGYFAEEGLDVTIDRGYGSADAVSKIASGAYDIGYADINSMIEFNVKNPEQALIAIAIVLDYPPFSLVTLKGRGITTPADIVGKKIGAPAGDASRRLFPIFAKSAGIPPIPDEEWISMSPPLREPMLIRGDVDIISAHFFTAVLNLKALGIPDEDIIVFLYADYGVDVYGNAVICPTKLLEEKPEAIRAFLRALTRAWHDTITNPQEAIRYVKMADPLIDEQVELERLLLAINVCMLTPDVLERGFGDVRPERLSRAIHQVVEAFALPISPTPEEVFTNAFLPPLEDRLPKR